jgi:hypothetical protein
VIRSLVAGHVMEIAGLTIVFLALVGALLAVTVIAWGMGS